MFMTLTFNASNLESMSLGAGGKKNGILLSINLGGIVNHMHRVHPHPTIVGYFEMRVFTL